jgi:predicted nucleotidyltransferase
VIDELDPRSIFEALQRQGVRYVLIGGLAATFHGSPLVTNDVDISPERTRDNLERLSAALKDLGARIRSDAVLEGLAFDHNGESLAAADIWNLTTSAGALDVTFVPAGTGGYPDLRGRAIELDVLGLTIPVAALADVVRSKEAAGREKDARTLPTLRRLLEAEESERRDR